MGFLIRVGFWLGLVLVLLPRDGAREAAETVGPLQVLHTASAVVGDFVGICERKPDVCVSIGEILHTVGIRAREGAAIAYSAIAEARGTPEKAVPDEPLATGSVEKAEPSAAAARPR